MAHLVQQLLCARHRNDRALFLARRERFLPVVLGDLEDPALEALHLRVEFFALQCRDIARKVLDRAVAVCVVELRGERKPRLELPDVPPR